MQGEAVQLGPLELDWGWLCRLQAAWASASPPADGSWSLPLPRSCCGAKCVKVSESHSVVSDSLRPHGVLQARILEWTAFPFSRGSPQPRSPAWQVDSLAAEPPEKG